jgi:hypothetical protein
MRNAWLALGMIVLLASCAPGPAPRVPLYASASGQQALSGEWEGQYFSARTQRYGTIRFTLVAKADSASGEVLMFAPRPASPGTAHDSRVDVQHLESHPLKIAFVMAQGDSLAGMMDPYPDENGAPLATRFAGRIRGDAIRGTFTSQNLRTSEVTTGTWNVKRKAR